MKLLLTFISLLLSAQILIAQTLSNESNKLVDQLEYAFEMRTIQHVEPHLSENFIVNEFSSTFSRQMLAGLIIELPIKKIKKRAVVEDSGDSLVISAKMVIAKYLGIFSQPIELVLSKENNKLKFAHMKLINPGGEEIGVQVEVDSSSSVKKEVNLSEMAVLETNSAPTYYEEGMDDLAKKTHKTQVDGLEITRSILGEEILFKIGYLIMKDSLSNLSINEIVIPVTADMNSEEEEEIVSIIINWVYFHEATELHLLLGKGILDPKTRWFRDGLADFVAHNVAKELSPEVDSVMMAERTEAYEEIKGDAQLLKWIGTGSEKKRFGIEGGSGQYAAAMFFFIELTEKYGNDVIPELLEVLKTKKKIKSRTIIKELSRMTGANIKKMLKAY